MFEIHENFPIRDHKSNISTDQKQNEMKLKKHLINDLKKEIYS